jgi:hypothetical protein
MNPTRPLAGTSAPSSTCDLTAGYQVGDIWLAQDTNTEFRCVDASSGAAVWIATISPASKITTKTLNILKLYLSSLSGRKLPYVIVGLMSDYLIYTNVHPDEYKQFIKTSGNQAYHFVRLKDLTFLNTFYELYPELKGKPCIVCGTLLAQILTNNKTEVQWVKNDETWSSVLKRDEPVPSADAPEVVVSKPTKLTPVIWFRNIIQLDSLVEMLSYLQKCLSPTVNKVEIQPTAIIKSEVNPITIAEKPLDSLGSLRFYIRYPLVEGYNTVSISEFHKRMQPVKTTMYIATWEHSQVLRTSIVYETESLVVWSYAPGVVWFPNKRTQA